MKHKQERQKLNSKERHILFFLKLKERHSFVKFLFSKQNDGVTNILKPSAIQERYYPQKLEEMFIHGEYIAW